MHGTRVANWAMDEADLIVAIGARFDDRVTGALEHFAPARRSSTSTSTRPRSARTSPRHIPIVGDAKLALAALTAATRSSAPTRRGWPSGGSGSAAGRPTHPPRAPRPAEAASRPRPRSTRWRTRLGDAIVTTDVGQHQMWAANRLRFEHAAALDHLRRPGHDGLRPARRARRPGRVPGRDRRLRHRRGLVPDERAGARDRRRGGAAGQDPAARQRLAGHGPPAAGHVLGRPAHGGRPRHEPGLGAAGRARSARRRARSATPTSSRTRSRRRSPSPARRCCTSAIAPEANCLPMFRPGGAAREMIG